MSKKAQFMMRCEAVVRDFVANQLGLLMVMSEDPHFTTHLRNAVTKHLELDSGCVRNYVSAERLAQDLQEAKTIGRKAILFLECQFGGVSSVEMFKGLRESAGSLLTIVLTTEIERDRLALFVDEGVRNCITKPISANNLVEKIAGTICPHISLSQLIEQGKACLLARDWEGALGFARDVLEIKPESSTGFMIRGDALKGQGCRGDALSCYLRATELADMFLEPLKKLAVFYHEDGDLERELGYLEQLDGLSPLNIERKLRIATIRMTLGQKDEAAAIYDHALGLTRKHARAHASAVALRIGELLMQLDPGMSEKYLHESLRLRGKRLTKADVPIFNSLGMALRRQDKWREAVANYARALKIAPEEAKLHYNLALSYLQGEKAFEAARHMDQALSLSPLLGEEASVVSTNIGLTFQRAGRLKDAAKHLGRAVEMDPDNKQARQLLKKLREGSAAA